MKDHQQSSTLREPVVDGHRFLLYFFDMIQMSVAHLYHSALPFAPQTPLWDMYRAEMKSVEVRIVQGREMEWTPLIRTVSLPDLGRAARYSHDGRMLAVGGSNFSQLFWTGTGERFAELESSCGDVESISFSCDDQTLVTASGSTVRLWDVASGSLITTLAGDGANVYGADFHPYIGHLLVAGYRGGQVFVWDMKDNTHHDFNVAGSTGKLCWVRQREQKCIIVVCEDGRIEVWDVNSLQRAQVFTLSQSDGGIWAVASSDDGSLVASSSFGRKLAVFRTHTGEVLHSHRHNGWISPVAFSPTAPILAFASQFEVFLWLYATDRIVTFTGHSLDVYSVAFSPNGRFIASASWDKTLRVWDTNTTNPAPDNIHHPKLIHRVHFSNDGQFIVSASEGKTVKVWDTLTGTICTTLNGHTGPVSDAITLPDNVHVVSRDEDGTLMVWDWQKGETLSTDTAIQQDHGHVESLFTYTHAFPPLGFISTHAKSYDSEGHTDSGEVIDSKEHTVCCWTVDPSAPYHACVVLVARGVVNTSGSDILRITHRGSTKTSNLTLALECNSGKQFSAVWDVSSSPAPLEFVEELEESPLKGTSQPLAGSELPCRKSNDESWIFDKNNRQILWVPPANRGYQARWYDRHLVIRGHTGRLTLVDFSDVILNGNIEF
jgi:WD40 repeat protein